MVTLQAGQLIYTSVEAGQSPRGEGGFQTLFCTASMLSPAEVAEIEGRLVYFFSERSPLKWLFFNTSGGKRVVAQVVPLAETDRLGRGGRYLAHALVLTPPAFDQIGGNAFALLLRRAPFVRTEEEALQRGDFSTGTIPPLALDLPEERGGPLTAARDWPPGELARLARLALRADRLATAHTAVAVVGGPEEVASTLEAALLVVPLAWRPRCTFDTWFHRGNLVATYYWAVGLSEPLSRSNLIVVDAAGRRVQGTVPAPSPEAAMGAYEHWAVGMLEHGALSSVARYRQPAFDLCRWLSGDVEEAPAGLPRPVLEAVFQDNAGLVRARLRQRLAAQVPAPLVDRLLEALFHRLDAMSLWSSMREGFASEMLRDVLYARYEGQGFARPASGELGALSCLLEPPEAHLVDLLYACWSQDAERLRVGLERLGEEVYGRFVQAALRFDLVDPLCLLVPGRVDLFLDHFLASGALQSSGLVPLVEGLIDLGAAAALERLAPHVAGRSWWERRRLRRIARKHTDLPGSFKQAVGL